MVVVCGGCVKWLRWLCVWLCEVVEVVEWGCVKW